MLQRLAKGLATVGFILATTTAALSDDLPVLRLSVLEIGTVNWELDTISHNDLDTSNGFEMVVQGVAGGAAAKVAFQGGDADVIVSDWIWVARQRAAGKDYVFLPYSKAVGGVLVPTDSEARSLKDLSGGKIGIAGGPLDKSWLILQAYAEKAFGMDLAAETEQVFGAPPLIFKTAISGDYAGAINYWHFMARMEASGMKELLSVSDAAVELGLDPETPLLGYVFKGEIVAEKPELVSAFAAASRSAKHLLATDDDAWERLRERMRANSEDQFVALRDGFRAGIPGSMTIDHEAAQSFFSLMAKLGGSDLVGDAETLPGGVFIDIGS